MTVRSEKRSAAVIFIVGWVLLSLSCIAGLMIGNLLFGVHDLGDLLLHTIQGTTDLDEDIYDDIIWNLRLPRILLAACTGMGLALSGIVMQAVFRNPLADPYLMGTSSGAALGVACFLFSGIGAMSGTVGIGIGAFAGAVSISGLLLCASHRIRSHNPVYLLILGAAASAVCSGMTGILIYTHANSAGGDAILYWMMGSISDPHEGAVGMLALSVLLLWIFFASQRRILNMMPEGWESALSLGIPLQRFVRLYLLINAWLTGVIVMNSGLIGFIGILVPHFARIIVGGDHKILIPASILIGGCLTVWADILGRTLIHGVDIPLGISVALLGAPAFLILLRQHF